jgi:hypothetical protein
MTVTFCCPNCQQAFEVRSLDAMAAPDKEARARHC